MVKITNMKKFKIKSSLSIILIYVIGSIIIWSLVMGSCWGIYSLLGPYHSLDEQLKIFEWMYRVTDIYIPLIVIVSLTLTVVFFRKKEKTIYKGYVFSFFYSMLVLILYVFFLRIN
jgi:hypothetical protein